MDLTKMFTGIINHCGTIHSIEDAMIQITNLFSDLTLGESIAVDGLCLTVSAQRTGFFTVELSPETKRLTTAKHWQINQSVNLERALRLSDRMGGHVVLGHVDTIASVVEKKAVQDHGCLLRFDLSPGDTRLITQKGCITVNGVSLTVNDLWKTGFSVMLIPHTMASTHLSQLDLGDSVNIEYDALNRMVVKYLKEIGEVKHDKPH